MTNVNQIKNKQKKEIKDKKISAKENYHMTMSETYVEPEHNCEPEK